MISEAKSRDGERATVTRDSSGWQQCPSHVPRWCHTVPGPAYFVSGHSRHWRAFPGLPASSVISQFRTTCSAWHSVTGIGPGVPSLPLAVCQPECSSFPSPRHPPALSDPQTLRLATPSAFPPGRFPSLATLSPHTRLSRALPPPGRPPSLLAQRPLSVTVAVFRLIGSNCDVSMSQ
eukprot:3939199-Rhodomonas_salina.3